MPDPVGGFLGEVGRMPSHKTGEGRRPSFGIRQGRGAEKGVGFADLHPQEPARGWSWRLGLALPSPLACPGRRVPELLDGCLMGPSSPETNRLRALGQCCLQHRPCKGSWDLLHPGLQGRPALPSPGGLLSAGCRRWKSGPPNSLHLEPQNVTFIETGSVQV